jgi:lysophospholipase L1-like esterase
VEDGRVLASGAMRRLSILLVACVALLVPAAVARADTAPPLPSAMASTGDSITRGFDATLFGCFLADCPQDSWATGSATSVNSQYLRIKAVHAVTPYNDAKTGAKMVDLAGQLQTAAGQGVDYATVLMGANDVCTPTIGAMTPVATFQAQFEAALTTFFAARPDAHVFVSSIPNIYQLWSLLHSRASSTWRTFGICQSMLSSSNTEAQRQQVVTREKLDNAALQAGCAKFAGCRFDVGRAVYTYKFVASEVSTVDYFHPSVSGQKTLARLTWGASYWPATP